MARASASSRFTLLVLTQMLGAPAVLFADDARYQDVVIGARAAGMGGAFTAISDDASGLVYNPAGMADVKRANLSISTSLYGFERHSRGGIFTGLPLTGLPRVTSGDINVIPSAAGSVMGLGELLPDGAHRHAIAFGLFVPSLRSLTLLDDSTADLTRGGTGRRHSLRFLDRQLWAGVGYAYRLGESVRLGVALHYVLRTVDAIDQYTVIGWDPEANAPVVQNVESELRLQSGSALAVVGVKLRPIEPLSIGMSVTTQSLQLHHTGQLAVRILEAGRDADTYSSEVVDISYGPEANFSREQIGSRIPWSVRLGAAWVQHADWTLAVDGVAYLPTDYRLAPPAAGDTRVPIATKVQRDWVVNGHIGFEKLLGRTISIAVGSFTNLPSSPKLLSTGGDTLAADSSRLSRIPTIGMTCAAGYLSAFSLTRVGFMSSFGVGDRVGIKDGNTAVGTTTFEKYRASEWTFYLFVSSTFRYGEGRSARADFGLPGLPRVLAQ